VLIWGVPEEAFGRSVRWRERAFRFVHNETYLNCYRITDALLDEWIQRINAIRPSLIEAYVDALHELSIRILKTGASIVSPRGIVTSAGVLTPAAYETIRRAFGAPIINRYGSREVSNVACSCGVSRELHVNEAWSYLEVVDEEGRDCPPGVEGDILVTLLGNRTMPLIRYRIEDRGVWASGGCPCGRQTRRLAAVSGRSNDYLVTRDGTKVNGVAVATYTALTALLSADNGIRQFQYRQREPGRVTLAIVPVAGSSRNAVVANVRGGVARLGAMFEGLTIDVAVEEEILPSHSGKFRYVVNDIAS
jgi:phenylacetate-CoA ligase